MLLVTEDLKLVMIGPRHLGAVDHLHDVQKKALGTKVDRPYLLKEPILLAMGVEDVEAKLIGGFYIEATGECCFMGTSPEATEAAIATAPAICEFLQNRGIRWLRIFVPKKKGLAKKLSASLKRAGFRDDSKELAVFTRDLRRKE